MAQHPIPIALTVMPLRPSVRVVVMVTSLQPGVRSRSSTTISDMSGYAPAEAARRSGFSLDTLRYYEKIGLLADVGRTAGGQRVFTDDDLGWLVLFRCLRDTGMPIAQMRRYAELARDGEHTADERQELL